MNVEVSDAILDHNEQTLMKEYQKKVAEAIAKGYDHFIQQAHNDKVFASLAKVTAPASSDKFGDHVGGLND